MSRFQIGGLLMVLAWTAAGAPLRAVAPPDGEYRLVLERGLFHEDTQPADQGAFVTVDLEAQGGQWQRVWALALRYNNGDHTGRVVESEVTDKSLRLVIHLKLMEDSYVWGGRATYKVLLEGDKDQGWKGTYEAEIRQDVPRTPIRPDLAARARQNMLFDIKVKKGQGAAEMKLLPPRPVDREHKPLEPGEHPRLLFRKSDLPRLRERMKTPFGEAAVAAMSGSSDSVVLGLMYQLTGDKKWADRALPVYEKHLADRDAGHLGLGQIWGPRLSTIALTYDMCQEAWPEDVKKRSDEYFLEIVPITFWRINALSGAANWNPVSNYSGPMRGGGSIASLLLWGQKGPEPKLPAEAEVRMTQIMPPADLAPGAGVPKATLASGQPIGRWIWSGAVPLTLGADMIRDLGGEAAARPEVGSRADYEGCKLTFAAIAPEHTSPDKGLALEKLFGDAPAVGYFYTLLEVPAAQRLRVATHQAAARVYVAGVRIRHGELLQLEKGLYPVLARVVWNKARPPSLPLFTSVDDRQLAALRAERSTAFKDLIDDWEQELAEWKASGGLDQHKMRLFKCGQRQMYRAIRMGMGAGGFQSETGGYAHHGLAHPLEYAVMYHHMFGRDLTHELDAEVVVPRFIMNHVFPERGNPLSQAINGITGIEHQFTARAWPIIPAQYQPGVLWTWNRTLGIQSEADYGKLFGPGGEWFACAAAWTFLHYPLEVQPKPLAGTFPLAWQAPTRGYYLARNGWQGGEDFVFQTFLKANPIGGWNHPNAGTFTLMGLGCEWAVSVCDREGFRPQESVILVPEAEAEGGCGRLTHLATEPDGSMILSANMDEVYGRPKSRPIREPDGTTRLSPLPLHDPEFYRFPGNLDPAGARGLRCLAVDYSGKCGAPALFVLVDKIDGGGARHWLWQLPGRAAGAKDGPEVKAEGNRFSITQGPAHLQGLFVHPADPQLKAGPQSFTVSGFRGAKPAQARTLTSNAVKAVGGDHFFFVATVQKGPAPEVKVEGRGLDARVTIGQRRVSFDGRKIVLE